MTMHSFSTSRPVSCAFRTGKPSRCIPVRATCTSEKSEDANRRGVIQLAGAAVLSLALPKQAQSAAKTQATNVGSYLPPAEPGFSQFKPSETQTPSIRAGVIKAKDSYQFVLPESWVEQRIANIQTGNFCMPRCDEPWQEMVFADPAEGKLTLTVMNSRRLTQKGGAKLESIGKPTGILQSLGPYITGTILDEEDLTSVDDFKKGDRVYYSYEANSLSGTSGPHYLAVVTTKGDLLYLLTIAATEAQWKKSKAKLKKVADSFTV